MPNNKLVTMAAFLYNLNDNITLKIFSFLPPNPPDLCPSGNKGAPTPELSLFFTDPLDIPQKTLQYCNIDPLLIEPGTYCMEGAWKLSLPVRLVETNQSSVSSREDYVTQLFVNFQLKTKPIDNVSAFCLLNSIICSCLLLDKNNHFSIRSALHRDTYDSFF